MIIINNNSHWLSQQFVLNPESPALIYDGGKISFKDYYVSCSALSVFLMNKGITEGDNVGVLLNHNLNFIKTINALWFIGAVPVLINTRNNANDIHNQLNQSGAKYLILESEFININSINKILFPSINDLDLSDNSSLYTLHSPIDSSFSSLILFTSGSSGGPKAVVHTFNSLFESVKSIDSFAELSETDTWLASLPFYHIGGFMIIIRALITGSAVALPDSLMQRDIENALIKYNPSHFSIVTTTLKKLLEHYIASPEKLNYVFVGGGLLEKQLCMEAYSKGWPIVKVYGSSESCSMAAALSPKDFSDKPDSSGKPIGTNKISIVNKNIAGIGEITIESASLFKEYFNDIFSTRAKLIDGIYYSGDFGFIDEEGFLFIESRREDIIITGGENVSAKEVEKIILENTKVKDVYVFGIPDETWGQKICACIVATNTNEEELKSFLKTKTASYKIPKNFYFIEEIPKNEMGKVNRTALLKILNPN